MSQELAAQPAPPNSLLNFIHDALHDPGIEVGKLDALLRMQREVLADQAKQAFQASHHALQAALPRVRKNGTIDMGGKGSMKFARWEDMDAVLRPLLNEHGFTLSFTTTPREGGGLVVVGRLTHVLGHYQSAEMPVALDTGAGRNNLQAAGSSLSYGKRYVAEMLCNIVREGVDDDGTAGGAEYVTPAQAAELTALMAVSKTGVAFLQRVVGTDIRSVDEVPRGLFVAVKNVLDMRAKAAKPGEPK